MAAGNSKDSSLGISNTNPNAEEIDKCWRFVYDIYTKHRDAFEIRTNMSTSPAISMLHEKFTGSPMTPRLSSISSTPSSIHEHRLSASTPVTPALPHMHNHLSNSNNTTITAQAQTFEEFMRQYVMHIAPETNVVSRIAVKSHSPLLAVKHPHHSNEYQVCAQSFDKTLNDIVERI